MGAGGDAGRVEKPVREDRDLAGIVFIDQGDLHRIGVEFIEDDVEFITDLDGAIG